MRITHLPTGLIVVSAEKSQHQNRRLAMQVLRSRLYEQERQKAADARAAQRKGQVGSGDRSQRIRTYNFPQGRVTDHRIGLTLHKLDEVLEGTALDELIDALITEHQAERSWRRWTRMPMPDATSTAWRSSRCGAALRQATADLRRAGIEGAGNDARRLLAAVLGAVRARRSCAAPERPLTPERGRACSRRCVARRAAREPVSRILGEREFYGRSFAISPATLDPRPDSETLIEAALELARRGGMAARGRCASSTSAPAPAACC